MSSPVRRWRAPFILAGICLCACRVDSNNLAPASDRPVTDGGVPATPSADARETSAPQVPSPDAPADASATVDATAEVEDAGAWPSEAGMPPLDLAPPPPPAVDCQVSAFGPWSPCSQPCGGGERSRSRTIVIPPMGGGAACPPLMELEPCNRQGCPVDCQVGPWSEWSACSKSCGGGEQSRSRQVITPASNGGAPCSSLSETRVCNPQAANACGGCGALAGAPGQDCGGCGTYVCSGADQLRCEDPARTCEDLNATCGGPPDGCGGTLSCGLCADALTSCGDAFRCICGKPTALYSPDGGLETGKRATSPDGRWYATAAGVFAETGARVATLADAKGFDWHPQIAGRYAVMYHFAPPDPLAIVEVLQIGGTGQATSVARGLGDDWHHAMAWIDGNQLALGAPAGCTTVRTIRPQP